MSVVASGAIDVHYSGLAYLSLRVYINALLDSEIFFYNLYFRKIVSEVIARKVMFCCGVF